MRVRDLLVRWEDDKAFAACLTAVPSVAHVRENASLRAAVRGPGVALSDEAHGAAFGRGGLKRGP